MPRSWGARVPVARLPAIVPADPALRHPVDLAGWQAETLTAFGVALAERWPFDLVHAHTGLPDGVAAGILAERLDLPLVVTEHDRGLGRRLADDRARAAYRGLFGERRRVVAVSRVLATEITTSLGLPADAVSVVPNLVDLGQFGPQDEAERDPKELLWVGARQPDKGTHELLGAVARLRVDRPALRLRMIGRAASPAEEARLRAAAAELGMGDAVSFEPPADRPAIARAMARAALFVHPSPAETFGIVAVEALASGLPVVAVSPAVLDLIGRDGLAGEAAAGADEQSIAAAIASALDRLDGFDPAVLRKRAEPFDESVVGPQILAVYSDVAGPTSPAVRPLATSLFLPEPQIPAPVVVGFRRRSAIARLGSLPSVVSAEITAVTSPSRDPVATDPLPPAGAWIEVDPDAPYREERRRLGGADRRSSGWRRLGDAIRHPRRVIALRRLAARRDSTAFQVEREAIGRGLSAAGARTGGVVTMAIAIDADDAVAIERARLAGLPVTLAPASLRWLADQADGAPDVSAIDS
jgi:glycosyltransferase involved in cell wall biosynthesis